MRMALAPFMVATLAGVGAAQASVDSAARRQALVRETLARVDTVAGMDLWPGFAPGSVPVAIFDGTTTWLINHPSPPAGFSRSAAIPGAFEMAGRPRALTANTGTTLGGIPTATVMADFGHGTPRTWAAVIAHEAFHVFQAMHHPKWVANEADLFMYPFEGASALAMRRLEFAALRRAVGASAPKDAACWGRVAMAQRAARLPVIGATSARYERMNELHEGLAQYVQTRAEQRSAIELLPDSGFGTDAVRDRAYRSGLAMGVVLDRLEPSWRAALEHAEPGMTLDSVLAGAVRAREGGACGFTPAERARVAERARSDSAARSALLAGKERRALAAPGWTVRVESDGAPLQVAAFDPLNVTRLSDSRVLHSRMIELARGSDSVQVLQRQALTDAAGSHPLFSGVRVLTVPGLDSGLVVQDSSDVLVIDADGLSGRFAGARADTTGRVITVRLPRRD